MNDKLIVTAKTYDVTLYLNSNNLGERLHQYRQYLGITMKFIERRCGVPPQVYAPFERGEKDIYKADYKTVVKILDVLELDPISFSHEKFLTNKLNHNVIVFKHDKELENLRRLQIM